MKAVRHSIAFQGIQKIPYRPKVFSIHSSVCFFTYLRKSLLMQIMIKGQNRLLTLDFTTFVTANWDTPVSLNITPIAPLVNMAEILVKIHITKTWLVTMGLFLGTTLNTITGMIGSTWFLLLSSLFLTRTTTDPTIFIRTNTTAGSVAKTLKSKKICNRAENLQM